MSAWRRHASVALLLATLSLTLSANAQGQPQATASPVADSPTTPEALLAEIRRLQQAIDSLQTQLADAKKDSAGVQQQLQELRDQLEEEQALLAEQAATLEQSKVESGSKYRARLFGMALMQLVSTRGAVDNIDLPTLAIETDAGDSGGNISAAVRQSYIGLAVFGPKLGAFATSGNMVFDFFGGFPDAPDGLSAVGVRMRTLELAAEGDRTSVRAGQEAPFFSPYSPSSLASTAYPAFSGAGNIWAWTPQVYVEHRYVRDSGTTIAVRGGLLDALTNELPRSEYARLATAGERSRMPAYAGHVGVRRGEGEHASAFGLGGYYSRHNWTYDRNVNAWTVTGDVDLPLTRTLKLTGEIYKGVANGGLGGGAHSSVLFDGDPSDPASVVYPLHSTGGWAQLKLKSTPRLEFNLSYGIDRSRPRNAAGLLVPPNDEVLSASKNAGVIGNTLYQLRSNLFLTAEYHRLWTTRLDGRSWLADHISLGGAVVF